MLPAAEDIVNAVTRLGMAANTVSNEHMASDVIEQLTENLRTRQYYSIYLDESSDITNMVQLLNFKDVKMMAQ